MTFARTLAVSTLAWIALITSLHATLNWGLFDAPPTGQRPSRPPFKVGFLPVT